MRSYGGKVAARIMSFFPCRKSVGVIAQINGRTLEVVYVKIGTTGSVFLLLNLVEVVKFPSESKKSSFRPGARKGNVIGLAPSIAL